MSQALPLWVQIFQALLTPVIGIGILIVAFMQWRTAHQKVIVDIFERRARVFEGVRKINRTVVGSGKGTQEQFVAMGELWSDARFLFPKEVAGRIEEAMDAIWDLRAHIRIESARSRANTLREDGRF